MQHDLFSPITANLLVVLGLFGGCLLAFDVVLVRWLKLSKVAWKRVDYICLGFGAIGLLGAVAQVRMESASAQLDMYEGRAVHNFESVKYFVGSYASSPGAICRAFVRSEYSPPPDEFQRAQNEYNVACAWMKQMNEALAKHVASPQKSIDRTSLPSRPNVSDNMLKDIFRSVDDQFGYFDQSMEDLVIIRVKSEYTYTEKLLVFLAPFLLAIALAIRITKVTGEIKHEP